VARRGLFVEGLEGAQYAYASAIDRLREPPRAAPRVDVLAAIDPACAWGNVLDWPPLRDASAHPARRTGASVVLVDGALALWVEPRARRISTAELPPATVELALVVGLPALAARSRRRELLVEAIDGAPAAQSVWQPALTRSGARVDYRGIVVFAHTRIDPGQVVQSGAPGAQPQPVVVTAARR
jgi:ATP-dependent Lhr-like helicase